MSEGVRPGSSQNDKNLATPLHGSTSTLVLPRQASRPPPCEQAKAPGVNRDAKTRPRRPCTGDGATAVTPLTSHPEPPLWTAPSATWAY
jgi:hypothetical protein